jgi:hypothetical protein
LHRQDGCSGLTLNTDTAKWIGYAPYHRGLSVNFFCDIRARQRLIHSGPGIIGTRPDNTTGDRAMDESFFERPILNSPYAFPARHWELDSEGQPTNPRD